MNMKRYGFLFALPLALLVGCGEADELKTTATDTEEVVVAEEAKESAAQEEVETKEETEVQDSELGTNTIYMKNKALDIQETIASLTFTIDKVQTSRLQVAEAYRDSFDGQEEVTVVAVNAIVENTVDDTVSFHPNQATLVTNTGEQVTADMWFSDDVGGEFLGKVKKEGNVLFFVKALPEELTELKLVVDGPFDADYAQLAEDRYEYTIDVTK
ncbi:DUF4352 domain-containing protein [Exiguobacterium sp. SH3S1]|uniref:DUF4352 domain-containing protein n=1 Tax=Exiguobacterium sp. SH3S1 TaxID=2510955 RepID=UPI00103F0515|nr:DUF4352 domain-containing protein [Exiguobacterium sp. SH3S1]TCI64984.1 DUF4352 domain-containing protein [Exiguobacterium sp. SH3S1]